MKKLLFIAVLALASITAYAQPRAIGVNLGGGIGFSYQHGFGEANMLDVAVYTPIAVGRAAAWGISGVVTYDWIDPFGATVPWNEKGEWHWYMGVGGAAGYGWYGYGYLPEHGYIGGNGNWGFLGAAGRVGVEFDFWFPLQLSIDWRPTLGVGLWDNYDHGVNSGLYWEMTSLALGVRYKF